MDYSVWIDWDPQPAKIAKAFDKQMNSILNDSRVTAEMEDRELKSSLIAHKTFSHRAMFSKHVVFVDVF